MQDELDHVSAAVCLQVKSKAKQQLGWKLIEECVYIHRSVKSKAPYLSITHGM